MSNCHDSIEDYSLFIAGIQLKIDDERKTEALSKGTTTFKILDTELNREIEFDYDGEMKDGQMHGRGKAEARMLKNKMEGTFYKGSPLLSKYLQYLRQGLCSFDS